MIVNFVGIISSYHCVIFVIPIEFMYSIITMNDMQVNVAVRISIYVILYLIWLLCQFKRSLSGDR